MCWFFCPMADTISLLKRVPHWSAEPQAPEFLWEIFHALIPFLVERTSLTFLSLHYHFVTLYFLDQFSMATYSTVSPTFNKWRTSHLYPLLERRCAIATDAVSALRILLFFLSLWASNSNVNWCFSLRANSIISSLYWTAKEQPCPLSLY